jgi:hypothetical protein
VLRRPNRPVARRSRRARGESDPRARGDSEGPKARLPAPGLSTASDDQGDPASAGNQPDFHPGTGAAAGRHQGLSEICPRACFRRIAPATCANDLHLETVADRWKPLGSDGVWTKRGPPTALSEARLIASRGAGCRSAVADQEIPAFVWVVIMTRFAAPAMRRSYWSYEGCSEAASSSPTDTPPGARNNRPPGCAMA